MTKTEAFRLLGGTASTAAREIGISPQAVGAWPEELTSAIADRVIAAYARRHPSPEIAEVLRLQAAPADQQQAA